MAEPTFVAWTRACSAVSDGAMGISIGAVKSHTALAVSSLRAALELE